MTKIYLNSYEYEVTSYNKSTSMSEGAVVSNASCTLTTANNSSLQTLMTTPITSITIVDSNDEELYKLENISARITYINEYLSGESVVVNVDIAF